MSVYKIALLAGVSVATVSRVLNGSAGVTQARRDSVMRVVKQLDYQPNLIARQLRTARKNLIQVLVPNISDPFCAEVVMAIEQEADKYGYRILLCNCHYQSFDKDHGSISGSMDIVDGVISLDSVMSELSLSNLPGNKPWVQCTSGTTRSVIPTVSVDDFSAAEFMVNYLHKIGRRHIAMITLPQSYKFASARENAYHSVLNQSGLKSNLIVAKELSFNAGSLAAKELFESKIKVDAIFTVSDLIAIGAIRQASVHNLLVPKDISISGFDGLPLNDFLYPKLTTIKIDTQAIGCEAFKLLLSGINGDSIERCNSIIKWDFVSGQTTEC